MLPRATVGLVVADGIVVDAPPYVRRLRGGDARQVWRELARTARRLEWLPDQQPAQIVQGCPDAARNTPAISAP